MADQPTLNSESDSADTLSMGPPPIATFDFAAVVSRATSGDTVALGELWQTYQPAVLRYTRVRVGGAADDVASSVWVDVAQSLHRFSGGEQNFRAWLFTIARRRCMDEQRRQRRKPQARLDGESPASDSVDPLTPNQSLEAALAMVRRLPDEQAEAVMLRVVADLDVAAVATIMARTEGSVRVLVHRGLATLSDLIQPTQGAPQKISENPVTDAGGAAMSEVS